MAFISILSSAALLLKTVNELLKVANSYFFINMSLLNFVFMSIAEAQAVLIIKTPDPLLAVILINLRLSAAAYLQLHLIV